MRPLLCTTLAVILAAPPLAMAQTIPLTSTPALQVDGNTPNGAGQVSSSAATAVANLQTGVTNGSNASAGQIGEVQSVQVPPASAITLTNGTPANVASVGLSAGDWQCSSVIDFSLSGATLSGFQAGLSTTSATLGPQDTYISLPLSASLLTNTVTQPTPRMRLSAAAPMTVYLVASTAMSGGTAKAYGTVLCRRMR